jgi:hypothetical protein
MELTLEQRIEAAHSDAERVENDARAIEARIVAIGGIPPTRPYGRPVSGDDIRRNLTLTSLLQRKDPKLAAYLGVGSDHQRRREEEAAARAMQAEALLMQTERLRQVNAASAKYREQQQLAGINPLTNRRWGL